MTPLAFLALIATTIGTPHAAAAVDTLKIGGSGLRWSDHALKLSGVDADVEASANRLFPVQVDSTRNLLPNLGAKAWTYIPNIKFSTSDYLGVDEVTISETTSVMSGLIDGDYMTGWRVYANPFGAKLDVHLGGGLTLYRIRMLRGTKPDDPSLHRDPRDLALRGYEVYFNNGETRGSNLIWTLLKRDPAHSDVELDLQFPPRGIQRLRFTSTDEHIFIMGDLEVYGIGVSSSARYLSKVFDLGDVVNFGPVDVSFRAEPGTGVSLRAKSGSTPVDSLYFNTTGVPGELVEVPGEAYEPMAHRFYRGVVIENTRDWSRWSRARDTPLHGPLNAPGARRYLRFDLSLRPNVRNRAIVDSMIFLYTVPAIADSVVGEISPPRAVLGESNALTFHLRSVFKPGRDRRGFDTVAITTPFEAEVTDVRVDGESVARFDWDWEPSSNQLRVVFDGDRVEASGQQVSVDFQSLVTVAGTEFPGEVFDSRSDAFPQRVMPGDASEDGDANALTVRADLEDRLFAHLMLSSPVITPNGDGVNDAVTLDYILLKSTTPVRVRVTLRDLTGVPVRRLYDEWDLSGPNTVIWDGLDDSRTLVPPGLYLLRLVVETDEGEATHVRSIAVVY